MFNNHVYDSQIQSTSHQNSSHNNNNNNNNLQHNFNKNNIKQHRNDAVYMQKASYQSSSSHFSAVASTSQNLLPNNNLSAQIQSQGYMQSAAYGPSKWLPTSTSTNRRSPLVSTTGCTPVPQLQNGTHLTNGSSSANNHNNNNNVSASTQSSSIVAKPNANPSQGAISNASASTRHFTRSGTVPREALMPYENGAQPVRRLAVPPPPGVASGQFGNGPNGVDRSDSAKHKVSNGEQMNTSHNSVQRLSSVTLPTNADVMLSQLVKYGFDKEMALMALKLSNFRSIETAVDILLKADSSAVFTPTRNQAGQRNSNNGNGNNGIWTGESGSDRSVSPQQACPPGANCNCVGVGHGLPDNKQLYGQNQLTRGPTNYLQQQLKSPPMFYQQQVAASRTMLGSSSTGIDATRNCLANQNLAGGSQLNNVNSSPRALSTASSSTSLPLGGARVPLKVCVPPGGSVTNVGGVQRILVLGDEGDSSPAPSPMANQWVHVGGAQQGQQPGTENMSGAMSPMHLTPSRPPKPQDYINNLCERVNSVLSHHNQPVLGQRDSTASSSGSASAAPALSLQSQAQTHQALAQSSSTNPADINFHHQQHQQLVMTQQMTSFHQQNVKLESRPPPPPYEGHHAILGTGFEPRFSDLIRNGGPSPPYSNQTESSSTSGNQLASCQTDHNSDQPVRCVSPLPEKFHNGQYSRQSPVRPCNPKAFRFYMEQHIENVLKQHTARIGRRVQLILEMEKGGLAKNMQDKMRQILALKESRYLRLKRQRLDESMFTKLKTIGVGAFGKVILVRKKDTDALYAMKVLNKQNVIKLNQAAHVKAERDILAEADSDWIVKLYYSFQNRIDLFFIMEYIPGGDMMNLLIRKDIFEESLARFYIAELTSAIEYVHFLGFIHRDIKPDNILIDAQGHIKLTDFGLCTGLRWTHDKKYYEHANQSTSHHNREDSFDLLRTGMPGPATPSTVEMKVLNYRNKRTRHTAHSLVGTSNYMAPEVLLSTGHTRLCDWWSVGVILYEMVVGCPPFSAKNSGETQRKVINWREYLEIPPAVRRPASADRPAEIIQLTSQVKDLIARLCCDPADRLGRGDDVKRATLQIKNHPWFKGVDFDTIREQRAPYVPEILSPTDTRNFDTLDDDFGGGGAELGAKPGAKAPHGHKQNHKNARPRSGGMDFYEFTFRNFFDADTQHFFQNSRRLPQQHHRPALAPVFDSAIEPGASANVSAKSGAIVESVALDTVDVGECGVSESDVTPAEGIEQSENAGGVSGHVLRISTDRSPAFGTHEAGASMYV